MHAKGWIIFDELHQGQIWKAEHRGIALRDCLPYDLQELKCRNKLTLDSIYVKNISEPQKRTLFYLNM